MKYLWTEDRGAGFHFWQLVNKYMFHSELVVETKYSNQGLLDAVRELKPAEDDVYYIAFDIVYDNMDVVNKFLELQSLAQNDPVHITVLDITCFEYIILAFEKLVDWTGCGRQDKVEMRKHILGAMEGHRICLENISDVKTLQYLQGFKHFSTERVIKSLTYELTDQDNWSIKGEQMGECWHKDCCVLDNQSKSHCNLEKLSGDDKMLTLLHDREMQHILEDTKIKRKS